MDRKDEVTDLAGGARVPPEELTDDELRGTAGGTAQIVSSPGTLPGNLQSIISPMQGQAQNLIGSITNLDQSVTQLIDSLPTQFP